MSSILIPSSKLNIGKVLMVTRGIWDAEIESSTLSTCTRMIYGVVVTHQPLTLLSQVRILVDLPIARLTQMEECHLCNVEVDSSSLSSSTIIRSSSVVEQSPVKRKVVGS